MMLCFACQSLCVHLCMEDLGYIIFGCRSPLVVDYEESLARCGLLLNCSVNVEGTPRVLDHSKVVAFAATRSWEADRSGLRIHHLRVFC